MTEPLMSDAELMKRLSAHPELRSRMESLLLAVEDEAGDLKQADAAELRVLGHFLDPGIEHGFELIAVRAAVPEEFDHLDFSGAVGGLLCCQRLVIDSRGGLRLCRRSGKKQYQSRYCAIQHSRLPE